MLIQKLPRILFALLLGPTITASASPQCLDGEAAVYFANGIWTTHRSATQTLGVLQDRLQWYLDAPSFGCLDFAVSYNQTSLDGDEESMLEKLFNGSYDLAESLGQNIGTFSRRFWTTLAGVTPDGWSVLKDAFLDSAKSVDRVQLDLTPELQTHVQDYLRSIRADNRKVVVVGHSQGNFFANQGYFLLPDSYRQHLGIVAVATFDSFVAGQDLPYAYTTLLEDKAVDAAVVVAKLLPYFGGLGCTYGIAPTSGILAMWPLCPNTFNAGTEEDSSGHQFVGSYLVEGSNSEAQILMNIESMLQSLPSPGGGAMRIEDVPFEDENLRQCVLEAAASKGWETVEEFTSLDTGGECIAQGIVKLDGMQFLTRIENLDLRDNEITDLGPLQGLSRLRNVVLYNNNITDVTPLRQLRSVGWLFLDNNEIADISPLSELTQLSWLHMPGNRVVDIAPLAGLSDSLTWLELGEVADVTPLSTLTNLNMLGLHGSSIGLDALVGAVTGLPRLYSVNLSGDSIEDVAPLASLTGLTRLKLASDSLVDVSPLASLTALTYLYLRNSNNLDCESVWALQEALPEATISYPAHCMPQVN